MMSCSAVKAWGKDEERGAFVVMAFVFSSHRDEGLEALMEMANHPLPMGSSDGSPFLFCLQTELCFAYETLFISTHEFFSLLPF